MRTDWLEDILALLEERNLTRAAARRNITQPAFSRRVRGFEDWLGVRVLNRGTNRIEIDPALVASEKEIRAIAARLRALRAGIADYDPATSSLCVAVQHAPFLSRFPEMAQRARQAFPGLRLLVREGNLDDCVGLMLRGDARMLLCYEAESAGPLPFGAGVARGLWGRDGLVPVVGGALRDEIAAEGAPPADLPAIVYPEDSYFGSVLARRARRFGTAAFARTVVCETTFSAGIREMALAGLGIAWLPTGMVRRDLRAGELVSLAGALGTEPLEIAIYADLGSRTAAALLKLWAENGGLRTG